MLKFKLPSIFAAKRPFFYCPGIRQAKITTLFFFGIT